MGALRDFFSWNHSVEVFCCLILCFVLCHVAHCFYPNCSISLHENAPSYPLKLEVANKFLRWYVYILPWKLTAVSINATFRIGSATVLLRLVSYFPELFPPGLHWSYLSDSNSLGLFEKQIYHI